MEFKPGDKVRTEAGELGEVVHVTRLSAFVRLDSAPEEATLVAFLLSQLTKIDPPQIPDEKRAK